MTTIKELYRWAVKHKAENLPISLYSDVDISFGDTFSYRGPDYGVNASIKSATVSGVDKYVLLA